MIPHRVPRKVPFRLVQRSSAIFEAPARSSRTQAHSLVAPHGTSWSWDLRFFFGYLNSEHKSPVSANRYPPGDAQEQRNKPCGYEQASLDTGSLAIRRAQAGSYLAIIEIKLIFDFSSFRSGSANTQNTSTAGSGTTATPSLFGNTTSTAQSKPATSLFGNTQQSSTTGSSMFGNQQQQSGAAPAPSLFGGQQQQQQQTATTTTPSLFGGQQQQTGTTTATPSLFGSTTATATTQPAAPSSLFGNTATQTQAKPTFSLGGTTTGGGLL